MSYRHKIFFWKKAPCFCSALLLFLAVGSAGPGFSSQVPDREEEGRKIAAELRCVVCQNLSVADSPSEMAQQMRAIIQEQLQQGKSPDAIKAYFVSKYGAWVLLSPPTRGFSLLVWLLPFIALATGLLAAAYLIRRWVRKKRSPVRTETQPEVIRRLLQDVSDELEGEFREDRFRRALFTEQARLRRELEEFEFDCQAGKLSGTDYENLRRDIEQQTGAIERELASLSPGSVSPEPSLPRHESSLRGEIGSAKRGRIPAWQLAAGGVLLLVLGIALGMLLMRSLKPRSSDQDSITGDFLTGTTPSKDSSSLLAEGRSAFERQEWPAAIQAFRKVIESDADHPEANSYMGLILAQAGHVDEALAAFDRALAADPRMPIALWGKGMLLYRAKEDPAHARELFERLVALMPPGEERIAVQKILGEMAAATGGKKSPAEAKIRPAGESIQGTVSLDPKLKSQTPGAAVLFIIARPAGASGPPLAVKKIERPAFPVRYILGPENSMIPGRTLAGKVFVSARLDQDGNPTTRDAGDWTGEYGKNPVEVGAKGVDITLDRPGKP